MSDESVQTAYMGLQGVRTTGIYCQASCTGGRPLAHNVSPYASGVAAEAAGFRPCLRCRPDRLPEPHLASLAPAAISHALLLISDGYLDTHSEDALARTIGYSARQLRRLFLEHVGATPTFVARSRRAHFARRLLDETDLPVAILARVAGFANSRQMHRTVSSIFGFPPSELRAKRRTSHRLTADGGIALRIPYRAPIDLARLRAHFGPRAIPGVETLTLDGRYRRTFVTCGEPGIIELDLGDRSQGSMAEYGIEVAPHILMTAHLPTFATIIDEVARARHMLDLEGHADALAFLSADPLLGPVAKAHLGLRVPGSWDRFEALIRIVIGQQISVAGASTMTGRIAEAAGASLAVDDELTTIFPTPEQLAEADLSELGLTNRCISTVKTVASAVASGALDLYRFAGLDDLVAGYCELSGIGPWTAQMAAIRLHRHPDAFPTSDLGIRKAGAVLLAQTELPSAGQMEELSHTWQPHRTVATQLLWTMLAQEENHEQ